MGGYWICGRDSKSIGGVWNKATGQNFPVELCTYLVKFGCALKAYESENEVISSLFKFKHNSTEKTVIINLSAVFKDQACPLAFGWVLGGVISVSVSGIVVGTTQASSLGPGFSGHPIVYSEVHLWFLNQRYRGQKYSFIGPTSIVRLFVSVSRTSGQGFFLPNFSILLKKDDGTYITKNADESSLKGQYHAIFSNTLKVKKTLFGW